MEIELGAKLALEFSGLPERLGGVLVGLSEGAYLILYAPLSHHAKKKTGRKNVVTARYVFQGQVFGFKSQILDYIIYPAALLFLSFPEKIEVLELRREPRIPSFFPAILKAGEIPANGAVVDLSPSGCRVALNNGDGLVDKEAFRPGERVQLEFYAVEEKNTYTLFCDVVNAFEKDGAVNVGVRFDEVHKHFRKVIKAYVERLAREKA